MDSRRDSNPVITAARLALKPDLELTVSQWADQNRILSSVSSGEPGVWRTSRVPYMHEVMNCLSPSNPIERVVLMKPAQIAGTEALLNMLGFIIAHAPGPALLVLPTVETAKRFSKQRLASLIESTPALNHLVADPRERDSGNTVLMKEFPGGVLIVTGANSAVGLRSMPARFILLDEVDGFPPSADEEGDPVELAVRRSETFSNRKIVMVSTPSIRGISRIESAYTESDQRRYWVPCPGCGEFQVLAWKQVQWPEGDPEQAWYECEHCGARIEDCHKPEMLTRGEWRADAEGDGSTAGFWLNGLYSPWSTWAKLARDFIGAQKSPERLKTWVNTVLAETWESEHDGTVDEHVLMTRREPFPDSMLPAEVVVLTAGVDVQANRLEVEIVGWGRDEESWSIAHSVIPGDPTRPEVWQQLDKLLTGTWRHPNGAQARIAATCIDAGYQTAFVTKFCRDRLNRRVYAVKGHSGSRPIWPRRMTHRDGGAYTVFIVGVDAAKEAIYARLKIDTPGAGYCHFPLQRDSAYFEQLTAETCRIRYRHGFAQREWEKKPGVRNEALDCRVYSYGALHAMYTAGLRLNYQADLLERQMEALRTGSAAAQPKPTTQPIRSPESFRPIIGRFAI